MKNHAMYIFKRLHYEENNRQRLLSNEKPAERMKSDILGKVPQRKRAKKLRAVLINRQHRLGRQGNSRNRIVPVGDFVVPPLVPNVVFRAVAVSLELNPLVGIDSIVSFLLWRLDHSW
jgi:hypothetical protein